MRTATLTLTCLALAVSALGQEPTQSSNPGFKAAVGSFAQAVAENRLGIAIQQVEIAQNAAVSEKMKNKTEGTAEYNALVASKVTVEAVDNKDMIDKATTAALMLAAGENGVWNGSTIAVIDADWDKKTSVWSSNYVRNGFDKVRPYMDWVGTGLVGASLVLNANGNSGITASKKGTAISGAGVLILGSVLQKFLGAKSTADAQGTINNTNLTLAQIMVARDAYDQIQARVDMATKYHDSAQTQLAAINTLWPKLSAWKDKIKNGAPPAQDLLDDIDALLAVAKQYENDANFVGQYTKEVASMYDTYSKKYTPLQTQFADASKQTSDFAKKYDELVTNGILSQLPSYVSSLTDARTQLAKQVNQ